MRQSFTEITWRNDPWFKNLCRAIVSCKTEQQSADFLRDVGTLTELKAWSERYEVARRIAKGETYRSITENTGASTTTVTRVARFLQNGLGYRRFLKMRLPHALSARGHHHEAHAKRGERMASRAV